MLSCKNDDFTGDVVNEEMKNLVHKKLTYHEVHEILALNSEGVNSELGNIFIEKFNLSSNYINLSNNEGLADEPKIDYFFDPIHNNETYSFVTHEYNGKGDYLEKFVVTVENGEKKAGYLRYYPSQDFDLENYTGIVEVLNIDGTEKHKTYIENGISTSRQTYGVIEDCTKVFHIKSTTCTHGGNHKFGEQCGGKFENDAYLYVVTYTYCKPRIITSDVLQIPSVIVDMNPNRGGGGSNSANNSILYLDNLPISLAEYLNNASKIKSSVLVFLSKNNFF